MVTCFSHLSESMLALLLAALASARISLLLDCDAVLVVMPTVVGSAIVLELGALISRIGLL